MPSISCVYCGGSHASADEVRACWQRSEGTQVAPVRPDDALPFDEPPAPPLVEPADDWAEGSPTLTVAVHRGPAELGRNVIVSPGQPAPADWADAPRVVVGAGPSPLTQLRSLAATRTSVVIEVHGDLVVTAESCTQPPHQVGPRHEFVDDAIAHLCVSNAFDLRSEIPRWPLVERAIQLGARSVSDGRGDVQLPTGELAWLDGGPPRFTEPIDGMPVLHRVAIEHGSLQPPVGNTTAAELAPDQLEAVTHDGGAARIIAPAGSGKTRVLTERARHLVQQWRIPPTAVCLVAFNKRAQEEIQARTTDVPGLHVRTLNAIALAIINGAPPFARQPARLATIDEGQVRKLIQQMVRFPRKRNSDPVATWIEALSMARLGLLDPATVEARYDGEVEGFAEVFPRYRATLARAGQVDFDEQVQRAIELLLADPTARATAQRACRFMLVDEFQDLTPAHLLLVRLLAGPDGAVFGVGDDDQTIYGYNGADPAWLIDFATLFPGAGEHPLEVNYRCPAGVVRAADTLLRHNRRRVPKTIRAGATDPHDGFLVAPAGADSVDTTVQAIHTAIAAGHQPTDIAVLTRVNSLLAPVQVALRVDGVPVSGGVGSEFVDRTAVRAGLAWLRVAASSGQLDSADVAEAFRRPARSVHPRIADWVGEQRSVADIRRLAQRLQNERDTQQVVGFALDIERMQRLASTGGSTAAILDALRNQMGLARTIASLDTHRRGMNRAAQNDDLTALAQLATLHPVPASFEGWLRRQLDARSAPDGVTLSTVHRVKGQEWPFVVVHHADDDQFPHRLAEDFEEERRLFHVAITRGGRDVLVVPGERPSPFLTDCVTEPPVRRASTPAAVKAPAPAARTPAAQKPGDGLSPSDAALFEALRALRRHLAAGKPAYTVLPDSALHAIAEVRPVSLDQLGTVKGVGPAKLKLYGQALLDAVAAASTTDASSEGAESGEEN